MAMHNIRAQFLKKLGQAICEWQVEVTCAEQVLHPNACLPRDAVYPGFGRTYQRVAQKMAPGFDMQYFHASSLLIRAPSRAPAGT